MGNATLKFLQVVKELGLLELIPPFNFGGNKLSGVAAGTVDTDAVVRSQVKAGAIVIEIDGDGSVVAQDAFGLAKAPYACTIKKATLISRESAATVEVDILVGATLAAAASITGTGTKPALSNAQEASITSFTNWGSVALTAGQIIQAKVTTETPAAMKKGWIMLEIERA